MSDEPTEDERRSLERIARIYERVDPALAASVREQAGRIALPPWAAKIAAKDPNIAEIRLVGSRAKGHAGPESDYDVVLIMDKAPVEGWLPADDVPRHLPRTLNGLRVDWCVVP